MSLGGSRVCSLSLSCPGEVGVELGDRLRTEAALRFALEMHSVEGRLWNSGRLKPSDKLQVIIGKPSRVT